MDCIFCKIVKNEIPSKKVYEDETVLAFYDIVPQAPVHVIIISKEHIQSIADITTQNRSVVAHISEVIAIIAKDLNLKDGFRVVTNVGEHGAQTVKHLHFHLLGGKKLTEKIV